MKVLLLITFLVFIFLLYIEILQCKVITGGKRDTFNAYQTDNLLPRHKDILRNERGQPNIVSIFPPHDQLETIEFFGGFRLSYNELTDVKTESRETITITASEILKLIKERSMKLFQNYYPNGYQLYTTNTKVKFTADKHYDDEKNILARIIFLFGLIDSNRMLSHPSAILSDTQERYILLIIYYTLFSKKVSAKDIYMKYISILTAVYLKKDGAGVYLEDIHTQPQYKDISADSILYSFIERFRTQQKYRSKNYLKSNPLEKNLKRLKSDAPYVLKDLERMNATPVQLAQFACIENRINNQLKDL